MNKESHYEKNVIAVINYFGNQVFYLFSGD